MKSVTFSALRSIGVISGLCLALLAPTTASAVVIDSFNDLLTPGILGIAATPPPLSSTTDIQAGLAGVLGGNRTSKIQIDVAPNPLSFTSLKIGFGFLSFASEAEAIGHFEVTYDNFGPLDVAGTSFFEFFVLSNDSGGLFALTLSDGVNSGTSFLALGMASVGAMQIPVNVPAYAAVDLSALTELTLKYTGMADNDMRLSGTGFELKLVPEPSSLAIALTGFGLAGVYFRRRRKQLTA